MRTSTRVQLVTLAALCTLVIPTAGCGGGGGGGGTPGIDEFVSDLSIRGRDDVVAVLMKGDPPAESGGPVITVPGSATVNPGVTVPVPVTSQEVFSMLFLQIPGSSGYWVLDFGSIGGGGGLGAGGTDITVDVTFGTDPPEAIFDCFFSGSEEAAVGPADVTAITVEECTVRDFCEGRCDPVEAVACTQYCDVVNQLPSCILDANAPLVCRAVFSCMDAPTCSEAGQCADAESDGAISSSCAEQTCEAIDSIGL